MDKYSKKIQIKWSDLDANRHVANTAFANMMIDVRIHFFRQISWDIDRMIHENLGPIILNESFYYLKEIRPDEEVSVNLELLGFSENYKFAQFCHHIFNKAGDLSVYGTLIFGWIDLKNRKLIEPPLDLKKHIMEMPKSEKFKEIPKEELRNLDIVPYGKRFDEL